MCEKSRGVTRTRTKALATEAPSQSALRFLTEARQAYDSLMRFASASDAALPLDHSLGGKLLYLGEFDEFVRPLVVAANIAGAATLTVSHQQQVLRQALRDGLIDFLVNSLDEALRILKNEIRKRQPVAVAVDSPPQAVEAEMLERGILPDLLPPADAPSSSSRQFSTFLKQGAQRISISESPSGTAFHIWHVPSEMAQQPGAFDDLILGELSPDDHQNHRWLRLSPRYLGTAFRRYRSIVCDSQTAAALIARIGPPIAVSS
jgi:hypothetical protein